jgi:hypothetical protein
MLVDNKRTTRSLVSGSTESLSEALDRLAANGFTHGFRAGDHRLRDLMTGDTYDPELLGIAEVVRFEGDSDPDEQATLFALRSQSGSPLGTYVVVYGVGMPPEDSELVHRLPRRDRAAVGAFQPSSVRIARSRLRMNVSRPDLR